MATRKWYARRLTKRNVVLMIVVAIVVWAVLVANRQDSVLAGQASVIDGDTLEVQGKHVRLHRMDRTRLASLQEERIGHC